MSITTKVSTTRQLEKIEKKNIWKHYFLYPILFQEDFYGIAYNRFIDDPAYRKQNSYVLKKKINFLLLKRLIQRLRKSSYSWINSNKFGKNFKIVQELIIIVFNFQIGSKSFGQKMKEWDGNRSIHSIFPFMEEKFGKSTFCLDITIPYSLHPEIFIRIFRQTISDISFLHFLRLLLHWNKNILILTPEIYPQKSQFYALLWNFQLHKFEYSLTYIFKQIYKFESRSFWFSVNQKNSVQKLKNISKQFDFVFNNNMIQKNCSLNYVRYKNSFVVSTDEDNILFIKNWTFFFITFWEKYFHSWFESDRIDSKILSKNHLCFLGYLFYIKRKCKLIRIKLVNNFIDTNLVIKEFCSILPIVSLTKLLSKEKFCDTTGRPICKVSWTTLTDHEIFNRFDRIVKNIFCYYSGCVKRKGLYQVQYILRFSCAKTLACKHKSTIRTVWKKYGSNFVVNSISLEKPLQHHLWHVYEKKNWYLNIIQINHFASLFNKLKNE
uniref:RNA maturase n=1 Tax=Nowellia curvifolia TaxID=280839 RepID=UPI002028842E|nr:RNA maturase [Nowellia curvifolia]UQM88657.1 RNA maturase [Nowellia curvifolia]